MDSKKNKKLEQDNDSVANNPATNEITESEESGYDSSVKGLMNHSKVPLAPKSLPAAVNQLVHEKVRKYLTEQVVIGERNEDQMSECQFSDTLRSLSPEDYSPPPSSAGTSYCTSRDHHYYGMVQKNPYQFLSSSPPHCSLKEYRRLWKMNEMKMRRYNEQKSKRTKVDMKWVDQFNLWKEKRRAKFESSHLAEDATSSINVVESEREKVQPSGVLAKRSEVSPLNASGGVCSELTTSMSTESPKKEFTMIVENKTLEQATTSLQENKQLANSFDRKLSLEDSGHFGGESDDTDERLSASPGTLDSPSSNVTRLNININGKQDVKLLTMGNCYGKLAPAAANNGIEEVNTMQSPVNVTKLAFELNDGLQKPENGIRRVSADGSELTYVCNLVRFQKERNFGFTLKGGLNSGEPLRIDQVTPGLSADRAGVKAGDILVSVNGALVRDDLIGKANMMIKEAVFVSHVELVLEKSEKEQSETNSAISTPRKLSSSSKDFTATGQSNSTNWFLQRRAMFEKLCAAESDVHLAKTDFRSEPKTEIIEDMKEISAQKIPHVNNTNIGNSVTSRPNVGYRVVSMYEPRQPGRISDFIPEYERKEETSNNYASTYNAMNECVTGSYRRTPSDCCPTLIRNYDLGNCNTNLAVGMALPSYRDEISFVDFEAEPDDASLSKPKHNCTTLKTSTNKIGNNNSNNRNVTNSWRAVDNNTSMEFKYWNMAANAAELNASVLGCNNNNSAVMNGNNTKSAASSMRHQAYNHWLVQEAEHRRLSDQLLSERTARNNHPDEGKKKMPPTPQAVSASHLCSHCNKELGHGAAMSIESLKLFYHLSCFKCYVCGVKLGDGAVGADVRVRCGKLHCQSCYSNDEAGYRLSEV